MIGINFKALEIQRFILLIDQSNQVIMVLFFYTNLQKILFLDFSLLI